MALLYNKCRWSVREAVLAMPKKMLKVAEVGVYEGANAETLLQLPLQKLYLIDMWGLGDQPHYGHNMGEWERMYAKIVRKFNNLPQVEIMRMKSMDAVRRFDDYFFDLVYIDATHTYEAVLEDLVAWTPKVHPAGYIIGDDWRWEGIKKGVTEFSEKNGLEMEAFENEWKIKV